ncbi:integrase arm-type DNA-binding domain-containing protein [Bradyrhizobium sp. th.b2]|uniref:tyrosine-type recombinase/integrase n=1 Tax=Bradyrhizobium sp. th-b2 TaxID=172088 RepID=UPI0009FD2CD4|nr:integrase arm-type DNA-binding domain-containing protein [Bradyrhizobium sp. th.b2]
MNANRTHQASCFSDLRVRQNRRFLIPGTRVPKLTDKYIAGLKCPPDRDHISVSDDGCKGLQLRALKSGNKSWIFYYWSPLLSKSVRLRLGSYPDLTLAKARDKVAEHRRTMAEDEDPRRKQRQERKRIAKEEALSFDDLADLYIADYVIGGQCGKDAVRIFHETGKWPTVLTSVPNKKSWKNDIGYLRRPRSAWGSEPAASVTDDDIADLLDEIAEEAPVSANRTQSILHKVFKWAMQPGRKHAPTNPLAGLERRGGKEKQRDRVLSDDEIRTLWWGLDRDDAPVERSVALATRFILTTMVRPYQSAGAETSEVSNLDSSNALYEMPPGRVKKDRAVIVPLSDLAADIVKKAMGNGNRTALFPSKFDVTGKTSIARSSISQALNGKKNGKKSGDKTEDRIGLRDFLGLKHFTAHDLRRTAATIARRAGAPREDVKAMLDHVNGDVTAVYDKYDMLKEKRHVVTILAQELRQIIGDGPKEDVK